MAALVTITIASPVMAQSSGDSTAGSSRGAQMNEPAGADNDRPNFSWLGLFGLLGLMGLKRKSDARDETHRPVRAT